jgi:hypothetical protein
MKNSTNKTKILFTALFALCIASASAQADTVIGALGTPTSQDGSLDNGEAFIQTLTTYNGSGYVNAAPLTGTVESFKLKVTGNSGAAGGLNEIPGYSYDVPINVEAYIGVFNTSTDKITSVLYASGSQTIGTAASNKTLTFTPDLTYSLGANQSLALILSDYSYSVGAAPATYTPSDLNSFDNPYDNSSVALNYNDVGGAFTTSGNGGGQGNIYAQLNSESHLDYTVDIGAAPEPSTWALMSVAGLAFLAARRRWVA